MQTDQGLIYLPQNIEYVLPKPKLVESVPSFCFELILRNHYIELCTKCLIWKASCNRR